MGLSENYDHFESAKERKHMLSGVLILIGFILIAIAVIFAIGYAINYLRSVNATSQSASMIPWLL